VVAHAAIVGVVLWLAKAPAREKKPTPPVPMDMVEPPPVAAAPAPAAPVAAPVQPIAVKKAAPIEPRPVRQADSAAALQALGSRGAIAAGLDDVMKDGDGDLDSALGKSTAGAAGGELAGVPGGVPGLGSLAGLDTGTGTGPTEARPSVDAALVQRRVQAAVRYPREARQQGLEGTVVVRARLSADGVVDELHVVGSVDPLLDDEAAAAVRRAAPFGTGPGWVRIPVVFRLSDAP
jgi:protein TonB